MGVGREGRINSERGRRESRKGTRHNVSAWHPRVLSMSAMVMCLIPCPHSSPGSPSCNQPAHPPNRCLRSTWAWHGGWQAKSKLLCSLRSG